MVRSAANRYWHRSLVPTLAKSTSAASCRASSAADGTSIITPRRMPPATGTPLAVNSSFTSRNASRARRQSSRLPTMGNISHSWPYTDARSAARSWVRNIWGRAKHSLTARTPRKGFSSRGRGR